MRQPRILIKEFDGGYYNLPVRVEIDMLNNSDESQMIRGNNVLEVNDISSGYNTEGGFVTVLKNLDFVVKRGEIFGIAGSSAMRIFGSTASALAR